MASTILKTIAVAFGSFCAWVILYLGWVGYYNHRFRKAGIVKPGDVLATDTATLFFALFRSPWYCLAVATIIITAVLLCRRWVF
jgi:hypothetical protein